MNPPTVTIEVDPQTAATLRQLQAQAAAQGVPVAALLQRLVANGTHMPPVENSAAPKEERPLYETATSAELAQAFLDWANSHDPNTPALTLEDVSRESIYGDRC